MFSICLKWLFFIIVINNTVYSKERLHSTHFKRHVIHKNFTSWLHPNQHKSISLKIKDHVDNDIIWNEMVTYFEEASGKQRHIAIDKLKQLCDEVNFELYIENSPASNRKYKRQLSKLEKHFSFLEYVKVNADKASHLCTKIYELSKVIKDNELQENHLEWLSNEQKSEIRNIRKSGGDHWDVMGKVSEYFTHLHYKERNNVSIILTPFCVTQLSRLLGPSNFQHLKELYEESHSVDIITAEYHQLVETLDDEEERLNAEHTGLFCKRIFKIIRYDPDSLLNWLNKEQKKQLLSLMRNPTIKDSELYDQIFLFYESSEGAVKEEATQVIKSGCRAFIERMFGDEVLESLEDLIHANASSHLLATKLMRAVGEISDEVGRIKANKSLPICKKIYLNYNGECNCFGNAYASELEKIDICDPINHRCIDCKHNTYGAQCSKCVKGYTATDEIGVCIKDELPECSCNGHTLSGCDRHGICVECIHQTAGMNCERCKPGYYGDALQGKIDDCVKCPCFGDIDCFVNDEQLVQCKSCPPGLKGIICDEVIDKPISRTNQDNPSIKSSS